MPHQLQLPLSFKAAAISQPTAERSADEAQDAKMFLGRITRADGKYILADAVSRDTFLLGGHGVKVKGTLDTASKIIQVIQIQVV